MAEKKPFIAARLRNPVEDAAATSKPAKKAGFDIIGNLFSLAALAISAWLLITLMGDLEGYDVYLGLLP